MTICECAGCAVHGISVPAGVANQPCAHANTLSLHAMHCTASAAAPAGPPCKVLVANRGEIARRVIRTCNKLGVETLALFTQVDALSPHVREATDSAYLGTNPREYTNGANILKVGLPARTMQPPLSMHMLAMPQRWLTRMPADSCATLPDCQGARLHRGAPRLWLPV